MARDTPMGGVTLLTLAAILVSIPAITEGWTTPRRQLTTTTPKLVTGSSQQEWTAKTFPNPQLQPALCSRGTQKSWVCDPNGILTKNQADRVDSLLTQQSEIGRCRCGEKCEQSLSHKGIQGAVAIANKMYFTGTYSTFSALRSAARKFAEDLRDEEWGFELCKDNYVIFISVQDREVFTATGENARSVMTDTCVREVYEEVQPMLSQGDYGNALELMIMKYTEVLGHEHHCNQSSGYGGLGSIGSIIGGLATLLSIGCCCGICCFFIRKRKAAREPQSAQVEIGML